MNQATAPGQLFIFAGASGSGKSTICRRLTQAGLGEISISHTTRPALAQEQTGVEYHFVNRAEFQQLIDDKKMAEWAEVHGELYGTGTEWLKQCLANGSNIFLDIDVQGTKQLLENMPQVHTVFILPPSFEILEQRLRERRRDGEEQINRRLHNARNELHQVGLFDYLLVNESLEHTIAQAQAIVKACSGDADSAAVAKACAAMQQPELLLQWQELA